MYDSLQYLARLKTSGKENFTSLLKGAKGRETLLGKTFNWAIYGLA